MTGQRGKTNEPRSVAIYLARTLRKDTLLEIGAAFGMSGYSPASGAVERIRKRLHHDKPLHKTIEQIKATLFADPDQSS